MQTKKLLEGNCKTIDSAASESLNCVPPPASPFVATLLATNLLVFPSTVNFFKYFVINLVSPFSLY